MRTDEEHLLQNNSPINIKDLTKKKHRKIPSRAIRPLIIAALLIILGAFSIYAFYLTYTDMTLFVPESRWYFFIISFLTIPAGSYTFFVAYMAWSKKPGYSWPMIF